MLRRAWDDRVVPRLVERSLTDRLAGPWRSRVCGEVGGVVLDIGFGSGRNLPYYSRSVVEVLAVDPSDLAWSLAAERVREAPFRVRRIGRDAAEIAAPDASVDAVVTTWSMCTIADVDLTLAECARVLRPGGAIHFAEHSLAPSRRTAAVQRRLQPLWGAVTGGCHIDRDLPTIMRTAGYTIDDLAGEYALDGLLSRPAAWFITGRARPLRC